MNKQPRFEDRPDAAAFEGRLSAVSLFDVCQFLMLNRKTGTLSARAESKVAYFTFHEGQLLNAIDDGRREGESVILEAVQWSSGMFSFDAGPVPPDRRIQASTESILLEAARQLDELRAGELGEDGEPTRTETLRKSQEWTATLGDAFRVAVQRGEAPEVSRNWRAAVLESLGNGSAERVLLGPGARIRFAGSAGDRIIEAPSATEVEAWMEDLLPATEDKTAGSLHSVSIGIGGRVWVSRVWSPRGSVCALSQPTSVVPSWGDLGFGGEVPEALSVGDPRPLVLASSNPAASQQALAGLLSRWSHERSLCGWILEPWPSFDWDSLPGRWETLFPEQCPTPGILTRGCEAVGADVLVVRAVEGPLVSEAVGLASRALAVILVVTASAAVEAVRTVEARAGGLLRPGHLAERVRAVWSVESEGPSSVLPLRSALSVRRPPGG